MAFFLWPVRRFNSTCRIGATPVTPQSLSDAELERVREILDRFGDKRAMNLEQIDGFLAALVCGPEDIPESEYLPEIWGEMSATDYGRPSSEIAKIAKPQDRNYEGPAESGQICSVGRRKIAKKIAKNKRCYANTLRPRSRMLLLKDAVEGDEGGLGGVITPWVILGGGVGGHYPLGQSYRYG
jgi:Uncharacterised protein family (UPF0149)